MIRGTGRAARRRRGGGPGWLGGVVLVGLVVAAGVLVLVRLTSATVEQGGPAAPQAPATWVEATAAQPSFSHWSGHVRAQLDLDSGATTLEQARARWAATKATGDADIAAFATAYAAYEAVRDGCSPPAEALAGPSGPQDPVLSTCRTELAAASTAVEAAKAVVDDWAAHVEMMKGKEHTDPRQYGRRWRDMVAAAPGNLARFAEASLALRDHVDCPRPT